MSEFVLITHSGRFFPVRILQLSFEEFQYNKLTTNVM